MACPWWPPVRQLQARREVLDGSAIDGQGSVGSQSETEGLKTGGGLSKEGSGKMGGAAGEASNGILYKLAGMSDEDRQKMLDLREEVRTPRKMFTVLCTIVVIVFILYSNEKALNKWVSQ